MSAFAPFSSTSTSFTLYRSPTKRPHSPSSSSASPPDQTGEEDSFPAESGEVGQQKEEKKEEDDHSSDGSRIAREEEGRAKKARLDMSEEDDEEADEEKTLPSAGFDPLDGVFRCAACLWEVVEGECAGCGVEHVVTEEMQEKDDELNYSTHSLALSPSRLPPSPRSSAAFPATPDFSSLNVPLSMTLRYSLTYSPSHGLIALADSPLRARYGVSTDGARQTVSFPNAAGEVHFPRPWKIHLGRGPLPPSLLSISKPEGAKDGQQFMHDLLDEVVEQQLKRAESMGGGWEPKPEAWTDGEEVYESEKEKLHDFVKGEEAAPPPRWPFEWVTVEEERWVFPSELGAQEQVLVEQGQGMERDEEGRVRWIEWVTRLRGREEEWDEDEEAPEEEEDDEEEEDGEEDNEMSPREALRYAALTRGALWPHDGRGSSSSSGLFTDGSSLDTFNMDVRDEGEEEVEEGYDAGPDEEQLAAVKQHVMAWVSKA